jgi:hypothetical protein
MVMESEILYIEKGYKEKLKYVSREDKHKQDNKQFDILVSNPLLIQFLHLKIL